MNAIKLITITAGMLLAGLVVGAKTGGNKPQLHKSVGKGFAVVELFTSEGCSSCPPADELVAKIQKESTNEPVYILSFHVDYWNRLGWKDVFSSADYSRRQHQYASWLKLESVYTPQIVVNGQKEFIGSEEGTLRNAIKANLRKEPLTQLDINNVQVNDGRVNLQYQTEGLGSNTSLILAIVEKEAQTHVKNGENQGRTLSHVQIVRSLATILLNGKATGSAGIEIPKGVNMHNVEVVGFLQNQQTGAITAASMYELNPAKKII